MSPEAELRFLILGVQREGNRLLTGLLAPVNVTPAQAEVIGCLASFGEMSLNELGKVLVCETGSPSRLVDTLVGRRLVDRQEDPGDRRRVTLRLTAEGKRIAKEVGKVEAQLYGWMREQIDPGGMATVIAYLRRAAEGTRSGDAIARRKSLKS